MAWTDEAKAKAIQMYKEAEPTPENSMDIVKEIAEELGESPNGVRMILMKADAYVKKAETKTSETGAKKATGGTRVSKEGAQTALKEAIEAAGGTVDDEIISKLTGKAAQYFTGVFAAIKGDE